MRYTKQIQISFLVIALVCAPVVCQGKMVLGLDKSFIEAVKNKATISTRFHIDALPSKADPHSIGDEGSEDGDIHMGGRDSAIRLPLVAEIINARKEKKPLDFLKLLFKEKRFGEEIDLTGVWRIWFEHLSTKPQIQREAFPTPSPGDSGMAHAFELHPVTKFGSVDTRESFIPIESPTKKFKGKDAVEAFKGEYETLKATIRTNGDKVTIEAGRGTLNYAHFVMQLAAKPVSVGDGFIVSAKVFAVGEDESPILGRNVRMVFVKDSAPAKALDGLVKGDRLEVTGIPRVNLHAVSLLISKLGRDENLEVPLPYEMIIVAVFPN